MRAPVPPPLLGVPKLLPKPAPLALSRPAKTPFASYFVERSLEKAPRPTSGSPAAPKPFDAPHEPARVHERLDEPKRPRERIDDEPLELDAAARTVAQLAPPAPPPPVTATAASATPSGPTIDPQLAQELVERAAFWGDGARGLARLRFGSKARAGLAGATVTLEHDGEAVRLRVDEVDDPELVTRLRERLAARGITVDE